MRVTLRVKLLVLVAISAVALVALSVSSALSERVIEAQVASIRDTYLPKIRARPALSSAFDHLARTIQDAAEASDSDLLRSANAERDALVSAIGAAHDAMSVGQVANLRRAIDDYFDSAIAVSRRAIAGNTGESFTTQVEEMQANQKRVAGLIDQSTAFDENALTAAFDAAEGEQQRAIVLRVVVGVGCLVLLLALSTWIGRGVFANLNALVAGFERFARNDFSTPIHAATNDELTEVATRANVMADELHRLDVDRARSVWVQRGLVELNDTLRGDLEPSEVADRTLSHLARYIDAPVGAVYHGSEFGPYRLLGAFGLATAALPASFERGEGLVGTAAVTGSLTVIDSEPGLVLRSGLIEHPVRSVVLLPIARGTSVTGVLELATLRAWRDEDLELLRQAGPVLAISLEVARARTATRDLLEQTRQQATDLQSAKRELEVKADELARASTYKSQFLANMSHELRTPLNAIIGFSEIMYDESVPLDSTTTREYLGDILTSGRHLLQLINDVLDLAKVEAGKLEFHAEPTTLTRVVDEVLAVLRTTVAKHMVEVATEIAAEVDEVVLDPGRLKQVLYNYLSNALKFTPINGKVTVRATAEPGDRVRIEIEDTGPGIEPDQLSRLFSDFQQTEVGSRRAGGTGLGLSLTKRLVEAQGGEVGVASEVGRGSRFFAILPRRTGIAVAPANTLQIVRGAAPHAPTVLVVEDDAVDRERLVATLSAAGYAVESVSTGAEAIARCEERRYNAITLDLLLPDMTGLDVLRHVRAGRNGDAPIIVVTVIADRGAAAGFAVHDVLAKPLSEPALLASLRRAGVTANEGRSIVLVVDDDLASLKVMSATLDRLGYLAVCEADPVRGLAAASEDPPAAIVLDLLMPGMTGFEFLDRFRSVPSARHVPVIVWTSKDLTTDELVRLRKSANAVVAKGSEGNARILAELVSAVPVHSSRTG